MLRYVCSIVGLIATACQPQMAEPVTVPSPSAAQIYWSDGDSGRLNGMHFRLANVDAPETGGVGARGGAKCEAERELGYDAKAFMVALTRDADLVITQDYGTDRYDRLVVDLSADGIDVGTKGVAEGHLGAWPHKGRRALGKKPNWCEIAATGGHYSP